MPTLTPPTREHAVKINDLLRHGLRYGTGAATPGDMCVEQCVCYALGEPNSDKPTCVGKAVRTFKISLNDSDWSSNAARAKGMARIAIAQLGSNTIDQNLFVKELALLTIRKIVPLALRAVAGMNGLPENHKSILEGHVVNCEAATELDAARAVMAASAAKDAARAVKDAVMAASAASYAAKDAARAAKDAASYAASAASYAASAASAKDEVLSLMAEIGVEALQKAGSPGCAWLDVVTV